MKLSRWACMFLAVLAFAFLVPIAQAREGHGGGGRSGGGHGGSMHQGHSGHSGGSMHRNGGNHRGGGYSAHRGEHHRYTGGHHPWYNGRRSQFRFYYGGRSYEGYWNRSYEPVCGRGYWVPRRCRWDPEFEEYVCTGKRYVVFPCEYDYY